MRRALTFAVSLVILSTGAVEAQRARTPEEIDAAFTCHLRLYHALAGLMPYTEVSADRILDPTRVFVPYRQRLQAELARLDNLDTARARADAAMTACRP